MRVYYIYKSLYLVCKSFSYWSISE